MRIQKLSLDTLDDYLSEIYRLEEGKNLVTTSDVARRLGVSAPTATAMLKKLADEGLVQRERYKGVTMTASGKRRALKTLRRHRLAEKLLVDALGLEWEDVHEDAHRLEHALSDRLVERIAAVLGEPEACPHGSPIPSRDGSVASRHPLSLWDIEPSTRAEVVSIRDEDNKLLRHLAEIGLVPGAELVVKEKTPYDEGMTVEIGPEKEVVGKTVAQAIQVERR